MSCSSDRGVWTSICSAGLSQPNQSEHPLFARECHLLSKIHVLRRKSHGWSGRWIHRAWFRRNSCPHITTTKGKALVEISWTHCSRGVGHKLEERSVLSNCLFSVSVVKTLTFGVKAKHFYWETLTHCQTFWSELWSCIFLLFLTRVSPWTTAP